MISNKYIDSFEQIHTCMLESLLLAKMTDLVGPKTKLDLALGGYDWVLTLGEDRMPAEVPLKIVLSDESGE